MSKRDDLATSMVGYLRESITDIPVIKGERPPSDKEKSYIAVNCLKVIYGETLNTSTYMNINVHCRRKTDGTCDTKKLDSMTDIVLGLVPYDNGTEDSVCDVEIDGDRFTVESVSEPVEDTDGTYYTNIQVKVYFNAY